MEVEGKICAIFWGNRSGCIDDQQAEIAHFFGGTGREPSSQNCTIPGGNWKLAAALLAIETTQILRGTGSQLPRAK